MSVGKFARTKQADSRASEAMAIERIASDRSSSPGTTWPSGSPERSGLSGIVLSSGARSGTTLLIVFRWVWASSRSSSPSEPRYRPHRTRGPDAGGMDARPSLDVSCRSSSSASRRAFAPRTMRPARGRLSKSWLAVSRSG